MVRLRPGARRRGPLTGAAAPVSTVLPSWRDTLQSALVGIGWSTTQADDAVARLRTVDLLLALPGVGEVRAREAMAGCGISPRRRLGGLGRRQREALIAYIGR